MAYGDNGGSDEDREGAGKQKAAGGTRSTATNSSQLSAPLSNQGPGIPSPYVPGLTVPQAPQGIPAAMATPMTIPNMSTSPYLGPEGAKIKQYQDMAREGVQGYGNMVGRDFEKQVGQMLGGINAIGGLRSGAVHSQTKDLMDMYGRSVGDYASMATRDAMGQGQQSYQYGAESAYRDAADQRARKSSRWGALGKIAGLGLSIAFPAKTLAAKVGQGIMRSF